jgi:ribonuclease HI
MDLNFEYLKIYIDGGSRGNPGPSAIGSVIYDKNDNIVEEISLFIGETTNNMAEYTALDTTLDTIKKYKNRYNIRRIMIFTDSKLLFSQVKRIWKIKNENIFEVYKKIVKKLNEYDVVDLRLIPREENTAADALVNRALDFKLKGAGGGGTLLDEEGINFGIIEDQK